MSIMLPFGSWNTIILTGSTLPLKGAELDPLAVMKCTTVRPRPSVPTSIQVQIDMADFPHLTEHFTVLLDAHYMSTAESVSCTQPVKDERVVQLHIQVTTHSPTSTDAANIGQALKALCIELDA